MPQNSRGVSETSITITILSDGTIENFEEAVAAICARPSLVRRFAAFYEAIEKTSDEQRFTRVSEESP